MTASPITAFALPADDGRRLTAFRSAPAGRSRAVVQIAHGMAEHFGRYGRLTRALTAAGYAVYGADHRGHGASAAVHGLGDFGPGGFQSLVDDMAALSRLARAEQPGAPLILLGALLDAYRRAGLTDIDHRVYPGGRHEMFNEIDRDQVTADLVAWLGRVTAGD